MQMSNWYSTVDTQDDIVISTRIRLARNLEGMPFSSKMNAQMRKELNNSVKEAILSSDTPYAKFLKFILMDDVPQNEIYAMVERHVISKEFAAECVGRAIIISEDESICIMVGEEDHIRIQVILPGFQLENAYNIASGIDDILASRLKFAFNDELGYLTECPTNLGTGMRASVMMHLPVINQGNTANKIKDAISKIGFTVRGMYGEGSKSSASLYQVSNQITLGITEKNALSNLTLIVNQIAQKEREARDNIPSIKVEDNVYRAYGTLKNQRILSSEEMMELLSRIKMGISMGILDIDKTLPLKLFVETQPFMLQRKYGEKSAEERDILRAKIIREAL